MADTIAWSALVGSIVTKVSHRTDGITVVIQIKHVIVSEALSAYVGMSQIGVGTQLAASPKMVAFATYFVAPNRNEIAGTAVSHAESRIGNSVSIIADECRDINYAVVGVVNIVDVVCIIGRVGEYITD